MGIKFKQYLQGKKVYACEKCSTHLTTSDAVVSKDFHSGNGKAYLFSSVVNVDIGDKQERMLRTGMHLVADINCNQCKTVVGWTYFAASERNQQYKVGKSVIEKARWRKLLNETPAEHFLCSDEGEPALNASCTLHALQQHSPTGPLGRRPLLL